MAYPVDRVPSKIEVEDSALSRRRKKRKQYVNSRKGEGNKSPFWYLKIYLERCSSSTRALW
jgi:hypothetical protein